MINLVEGLTFDDVLLVPKFSKIKTRKSIDLSVQLDKGFNFSNPIIPANMKTVTGFEMAKEIYNIGGMAIMHRFMPWEEQMATLLAIRNIKPGVLQSWPLDHIGFSIGVKEEDYIKVDYLVENGVRILCIDIAHGDSEQCIDMIKYVSEKYPKVFLIAGNVATREGAERLWRAGTDCVKVGIGPGSLCTTRIETGNGVPQLTALSDIYDHRNKLTEPIRTFGSNEPKFAFNKRLYIIADGGIKSAGDIVKALCFSDMVMAGNLFAGTNETPGDILQVDGKRFKNYVGSSTHKTNHIEGVMALVPTKGPVANVMTRLCEGLKSGLSYQGCSDLTFLRLNPKFVRITNAGLKESHAHDVVVV